MRPSKCSVDLYANFLLASQKQYSCLEFEKVSPIEEMAKESSFKQLNSLADTLTSWQEEILRMLRFSKSHGITEGFHNKMENISRVAYGFRNFQNYRLRVLVKCA